ncbi:MAG: CDP-glycerol glycerophosphotransferase family protein [Kiritimatiellae bacterium]|nr:CDP-glycerol glycerophosphotransferase family protein [Kiritimatiellia bacterium]
MMDKLVARFNKYTSCLKKAIKKIRDPEWRLQHRYIAYYDTLPIQQNFILLESQHGRELNGIIFQIAAHLAQAPEYQAFTIYVAAIPSRLQAFRKKLDRHNLQRIHLCAFKGDAYYRLLASAHYLINDNTFMPFFIKKDGQIYLNTWHGTPLKTLGKQVVGQAHLIGNVQKNFLAADYLLCPNTLTDEALRRDYMIDNLAKGKRLFGGYPRNAVFFQGNETADIIRKELGLTQQRIYAYLPTYRGTFIAGKTSKSDTYLRYHFYELDRLLTDDECLLVNLHPVSQSSIRFNEFKHIRPFPANRETYEVLTAVDVLITDYSSVFFDFACSRKKIVLFTYDKEEYLRDRGIYFPMEELPFPQVTTAEQVLEACRSPKTYDDTRFLATFCPYDNADTTKDLCRHVILGEKCLREEAFPDNGKENVLIYAGNLDKNGITTALMSLLNAVDRTQRNYIIVADLVKVKAFASTLTTFPTGVTYLIHHGDITLSFADRVRRVLFKLELIPTKAFLRSFQKRFEQDTRRTLATSRINTVLHFTSYENETLLWFSTFQCRRLIFVHSDMVAESQKRGNARKEVLQYIYNQFDRVVAVTPDLLPSTQTFIRNNHPIDIVRNFIVEEDVLQKATLPCAFDSDTVSTHSLEDITTILNDKTCTKLVSVGRFSPEKGHLRLLDAFKRITDTNTTARLLIIGGNAFQNWYQRTLQHVESLGLTDRVILIHKVSNPFPFIKACDGFVLSSFYEGFGLVLAEADILGLPVISTDITGPRRFMQEHGGALVDNSEEGLYQGMKRLLTGDITPMSVDYKAYNQANLKAFEALFQTP